MPPRVSMDRDIPVYSRGQWRGRTFCWESVEIMGTRRLRGGNNTNNNSNNSNNRRLAGTKRRRNNSPNSPNRSKTVKRARHPNSPSRAQLTSIPLNKLLLTDPIFKAAKRMNPDISVKGFKRLPGGVETHGFPLTRVNTIRNANFHDLPPIVVTPFAPSPEYYSIVDGRHRFAKALAEGRTEIDARIITQ